MKNLKTKTMKNTGRTTMMIKAKGNNRIHAILNPNPVKNSDRWRTENRRKPFTDAEKIEMFDKIAQIDKETSSELGSANYQKRFKKRVTALRIAKNGDKPAKRRTTKAQWEAMQQENDFLSSTKNQRARQQAA